MIDRAVADPDAIFPDSGDRQRVVDIDERILIEDDKVGLLFLFFEGALVGIDPEQG